MTKGRLIERSLLVTILGLQIAILVYLAQLRRDVDMPSEVAAEGRGSVVAARASGQDEMRTYMAQHPKLGTPMRVAPAPSVDRVFDHMNAVMFSAMRDMERMSYVMSHDAGWERMLASPSMDMREADDSYVVLFSIPDVRPSDVQVVLEGRLLTVLTPSAVVSRRYHGAPYRQMVELPGPIGSVDSAQASLTNGILRVTIPKGATAESLWPRMRLY